MALWRTSRVSIDDAFILCLRTGARTRSSVPTFATPELASEWRSARPYDDVPGPKPLPVLGNIWRFLPFIGSFDFSNLIKVQQTFNKSFGNIVKLSGLLNRKDIVFIFEPEDIQKIYRYEGQWPFRPALQSLDNYRSVVRKDFFKGMGGVLNDQGKAWQEARSQVNPVLMQTKTVQLYASQIDKVAEDFAKKIPNWRDSKNEMPESFTNELHKWALESIALIALDTRLGCLEANLAPDSEPQRMIDAVQTLFKCMHNLEIGSRLWTIMPTPTLKKFHATMDFFVDVSMKYITHTMEKMKDGNQGASVLERFLARDPNPTRAVIMALDMLLAGVDTTSYTLANNLLVLSANPEKQEKLHAELRAAMPDPNVPLTADILNNLTYLKACIRETTRTNPVVTGNIRTTQDEIVLSGYQIPKGVDILMANSSMSLMEKHYPDADKYVPERWLRQKEGMQEECPYPGVKPNPYVSLPFGHGARKCVGMRFANLEIEILLAKLVRRFRWEFKHGQMQYKTTLLHAPVDPLRFTVHLRD